MTSPVVISSPMIVRVESTHPCGWSVTEPQETKSSAASRARKVIASGAKACSAKAHSAKVIACNAKASAARVLRRRAGGALGEPGEAPVCELQHGVVDESNDMVTLIDKVNDSDVFPLFVQDDDSLEVMSLGSGHASTGLNEPQSLPGTVDDSDCSLPGSIPVSAGSDSEGL